MAPARRDGEHLAVQLSGGRQQRPDALVFAAGRSVTTTGLDLDKAGVEVDARGRIIVDAQLRTSCPWVFVAGDVIGPSLASIAADQGRQALCGALGLDFSAHVDQTPAAAIYGLPEVAAPGKARKTAPPAASRTRSGAASSGPPRAASSPGRTACSS
jgi:NAD(P) transhydrogenase